MKTPAKPLLILAILWLSSGTLRAQSQQAKEQITKEFTIAGTADKQVLALYNVFGSVAVRGYAGNKVLLEVTKTITAPDGKLLETGRKEVQLGFIQRHDSLIVYTAAPYDSRPHNEQWYRHNSQNQPEPRYRYTLDYTLTVPSQLNLHVSTVNGGKVTIEDVAGVLHAFNVNGAIAIRNAQGARRPPP